MKSENNFKLVREVDCSEVDSLDDITNEIILKKIKDNNTPDFILLENVSKEGSFGVDVFNYKNEPVVIRKIKIGIDNLFKFEIYS